MIIKYSRKYNVFLSFDESAYDYHKLKLQDFIWSSELKHFITDNFRAAEKFYENLDPDAREIVNRKIKEAKNRARIMEKEIGKSQLIDSKLEVPYPESLEYYPFQKAGIEYIINHKNVLLGDEMGLGKTIEAIGYINYRKPKNVLIICPAIVKMVWVNELNTWLVDNYSINVVSSGNKKTGGITIDIY